MTAGELHKEIVARLEAIELDGAGDDRLRHNPKHANETPAEKDRRFTLRPRRMYLATPAEGGHGSCEYRIEYLLEIVYNPTGSSHVPRMMEDAVHIIDAIWRLGQIPGVTQVEETNQDFRDEQSGPAVHSRDFNIDFDPRRG